MTTLDNIFNPYERNRWYYADKEGNLEICPINICYESGDQEISKTKTIYKTHIIKGRSRFISKNVPKTVYENLKVKHYIKISEECPICYDPIIHKRDAYLTDCGHSFHLSCINAYYYKNYFEKEGNIWCPICRSDIGTFDGLKNIYCNSNNRLDKLEDFWNTMSYEIPRACGYDHFTGLNDSCIECLEYRKCKIIKNKNHHTTNNK